MTIELLAADGQRSATIEEYVDAARLLTRMRQYYARLQAIAEEMSEPGFERQWQWEYTSLRGDSTRSDLAAIDDRAFEMDNLLSILKDELEKPIWDHIEEVVRTAARPFRRSADSRGSTYCVPDARGEWIVRGTGQLVRGTQAELEAADQRWTAIGDVLPPRNPSEVATALGPGVR